MENEKIAIKTVVLDITLDGMLDKYFIEYLEKNNILFKVLDWRGPAGFNPLVQFWGSENALKKFMRDQYATGDKIADDYNISLIESA